MVFNKSPLPGSIEKQGELVTFERIKKPRHIMTKALYDLLKTENKAEFVKLFVYRKGGNTRVGGQKDLFVILYLIRKLFIPSLHVSDDYRYIHDLDQEIDKAGFKKNLSIPSQKWRTVNAILKEYTDIEIHSEDATPQMFKRWGRFS